MKDNSLNIFTQSYFVADTIDSGYVDDNSNPLRRVYSQYRNKTKLTQWMRVCTVLGSNVFQTGQLLRKSYDVNNISNELLNVVGRIVVLPRTFISPVSLNPPNVASSINTPWDVGMEDQQLSGLTIDSDTAMSDDLYRLGIRAKIVKNNTAATIEDVLTGVAFLLPDAQVVRINDNEDMTFTVEYSGVITPLEMYALSNASLVPTPQGVKFNGFVKVSS